MKRLVALGAVALMGLGAFAQGGELNITSRVEAVWPEPSEESSEWGMGFSSLYAFLDGSFNDHFSYSASMHLLSNYTKDLYNPPTSKFVDGNFLNWAYLSYDNDWMGVDAGKISLNIGSFENELNDVDCFSPFVSPYWSDLNIYQWGGTFRLNPSENQSFEVQLTTSPFMEHWRDHDWAWSVAWRGKIMGTISTNWSLYSMRGSLDYGTSAAPALTEGDHVNYTFLGLGNRYEEDKLSIDLDLHFDLKDGWDNSCFQMQGNYDYSDKIRVGCMAGLRHKEYPIVGAYTEYRPSPDLRIHAYLSDYVNNEMEEGWGHDFACSIGVTYNLNFPF